LLFFCSQSYCNRGPLQKDGLNGLKSIASVALLCQKDDGFRCVQPIRAR
jgi:hypothetical protein